MLPNAKLLRTLLFIQYAHCLWNDSAQRRASEFVFYTCAHGNPLSAVPWNCISMHACVSEFLAAFVLLYILLEEHPVILYWLRLRINSRLTAHRAPLWPRPCSVIGLFVQSCVQVLLQRPGMEIYHVRDFPKNYIFMHSLRMFLFYTIYI